MTAEQIATAQEMARRCQESKLNQLRLKRMPLKVMAPVRDQQNKKLESLEVRI